MKRSVRERVAGVSVEEEEAGRELMVGWPPSVRRWLARRRETDA